MKERWKLVEDRIWKPKDPTYYLIKEAQIWRFYFRVIKEHFTPCNKCQEKIEKLLNDIEFSDSETVRSAPYIALKNLCNQCEKEIAKVGDNADIILGNKDYEPPLELSRKWDLSDECNPETIDLTEAEYKRILETDGHAIYVLPQWLLVKKNTLRKPTPY